MNLTHGDYAYNIQIAPVYGCALGILYYDPTLENDDEIEEDDYYQQIAFMFVFFSINIMRWKY